jgi:hypothetical protein
VGDERKVETALERMGRHAAEALGGGLGVAVLAARRDLRSATHGVPCSLGPLDAASVGHEAERVLGFGSTGRERWPSPPAKEITPCT